MPVYTSKIAVAKNEHRQKKQGTEIISASWKGCEDDNLGDKNSKNTDTKEQSPVPVTQVTPNLPSNTSPVNEKDKIAPPPRKYFITVNSDSDETLSNIESVPNSPGQDNWQISAQRYSSLTNNHQKNNHPQSKSPKRDRSPVACEISRCMNIENTKGDQNTESESGSIIKRQRLMIGGTLICSDEKTKLQPQYHTEASSTENPSVLAKGSEKNTGDITHHNILKSPEEVSWLRHYERPRATYLNSDKNISKFENNGKENLQKNEILSCAPKKNDETIKKPINVTIASDPAQPNSHAAGYLLGGRHDKRPKPVTQKLGKRGRPRKQDYQKSGPNSEMKKKPQGKTSDTRFTSEQTSAATGGEPGVNNSTSRPSGNGLTLNGHALSLWELQTLFFKFLQHGHFRVDPEQPLIFTFNNDDNKSFAAGMQCYDPKGYHTQPGNTDMTNNCDSKKNPHSQRRFSTNNDDSRHHSMHNAWPNDTSHWNCNSELPIYTNPISNYMQPQHSSPSHYHQNIYNNNANLMGNNINSDRGYMNSNSPMNDASNFSATTSNTNINFNQNIQRRYENSVNSREIDLSMTNKNAMPNNSMNPVPNISANNLSPSWRSDNTNGVITNANSMNCLNEFSQTLEGSTSVNNFIHSQNSPISVSDSWINRTNNAFNINRYSTFPPWQGSFPMYSSCLNNADPYYKNMFNPCNTLMALDLPNYPYQYTMENNSNQWMQNITPGDTGISAFNAPGSQYPRTNYGFSEEHPMNQGINLSLSSEAAVNTIVPETSFIDPDEANSGMEYRSALKRNSVESKKNAYQKVVSGVNNEMQTNARSYSDPICVPYSKGYKNDIQTRDIDDIDVINVVDDDIDILEEQNLPHIQDYVNRTLDSFEGCFNHAYKASNSSNFRTVTDLSNNTETELTKLRQELADFTKQYSENQTSSESSILHDDVYNYMMTQNLDVIETQRDSTKTSTKNSYSH
ncbi:LOW QUALITY PROTEIN: putative uncharacterized protein DDB_G0282133 [Diprion similis]|uniref:LOW QUALITY PROTEIN: putative uncharacterized protein DDB_G0282133 n=1 Tax=Diprion similis TaxID=362088 RepID=UPI001EF93551|nr:LOW QUALITY PROTEIN: putative uncharacterized protein DDB_G0282133 [Diprion similis]